MTLVLLFQDGNGAATGGSAGGPVTPGFMPAVHHKVGVRQPDVPSAGGGIGLAMWGWLRGLSFG